MFGLPYDYEDIVLENPRAKTPSPGIINTLIQRIEELWSKGNRDEASSLACKLESMLWDEQNVSFSPRQRLRMESGAVLAARARFHAVSWQNSLNESYGLVGMGTGR